MTKNNNKNKQIGMDINGSTTENVLSKNLDVVIHESMIPYSEHVILERALPRVEDGLKPVQRRILYAMNDLGITPDKPFKKSARIVGECLGKYHPHGDSSVYDAMVHLAQDYNMRAPLVLGHGNFGSVDGDSAAAMRYTEAKLSPIAMELLKDLEKNTVSWSLNFDDTLKEPDMLPAAFPNLLVNGAMGIAVGLATNIPTHNLGEVIDGTIAYIDNPNITLKQMMKFIPGPDFPTGGYVVVDDELTKAYETGRGKIINRAKYHVEDEDDKKSIIITEIPYGVNKATTLQKINELCDGDEDGKTVLAGIADIRDESDMKGMRAVIKLKKGVNNADAVMKYLFKYTDLQTTFGINMVAIANGKPMQLGLIDLIKYYVIFRKDVILKRTKFDLEVARDRAEIIEGLMIAIQNIDEVVKIIKKSESVVVAKQKLMSRFNLKDVQAQAILDMRLARLTSLEIGKLKEELEMLKKLIDDLTAIVKSDKKQYEVVKKELLEVKRIYKDPRRTTIIKKGDTTQDDDNDTSFDVPRDVVVGVTSQNTIKVVPIKNFNLANKDFTTSSTMFEVFKTLITTKTNNFVYLFTKFGKCFKISIKDIPECKFKDKGAKFESLVNCEKGDKIVNAFVFADDKLPNLDIVMFTKFGFVKKSSLTEYVTKGNIDSIKLKENDEVVSCFIDTKDCDRMLIATKMGNILSAKIDDISSTGRATSGVRAIDLNDNDEVIFAGYNDGEGELISVSNDGYAKRVIIASIDVLSRYRKGVKLMPLNSDDNYLIYVDIVKYPYTIVAKDINDLVISKFSDDINISSRSASGKSLVKVKAGLVLDECYTCINSAVNEISADSKK
jgi:DNA gyrase/topoisomerase IV subunit A